MEERMKVCVRIRPLFVSGINRGRETNVSSCVDKVNNEVKVIDETGENGQARQFCCKYDNVFGESIKQDELYNAVGVQSVKSFLKGYNSTIFCYGQTGSGKTHTMFGAPTMFDHKKEGIIYRAVADVFNSLPEVKKLPDHDDLRVYVSMLQIYNEQVFDLLRDPQKQCPLSVHEDETSIYVAGLSEYCVANADECLAVVASGDQRRSVRSTDFNDTSSRSHTIFQLLLERTINSEQSVVRSKLNLVDLAGSEKWNTRSYMAQAHADELTNINRSLHVLGRCIKKLSERDSRKMTKTELTASNHIPYRDSKLTRILQDSLGGTSYTTLIATISPDVSDIRESISTLRFADCAKNIMQNTRIHKESKVDHELVQRLYQQIEQLKLENEKLKRNGGRINDTHDATNTTNTFDNSSTGANTPVVNKSSTKMMQSDGQVLESANASDPLHAAVAVQTLKDVRRLSKTFFDLEIEEEEYKESLLKVIANGLSQLKSTKDTNTTTRSFAMKENQVKVPDDEDDEIQQPGTGLNKLRIRQRRGPSTPQSSPYPHSIGFKGEDHNSSGVLKPFNSNMVSIQEENHVNSATVAKRELKAAIKRLRTQRKLQAWYDEKAKKQKEEQAEVKRQEKEEAALQREKETKRRQHAAQQKKKVQKYRAKMKKMRFAMDNEITTTESFKK